MSGGKVFFSYASADRARVEPLVRLLEAEGLNVWWDRDIPRGKSFSRVIEEHLREAQCAVVVWSRASVASEWVFNEASDARKRGILVPVLFDEVEPPLEFRHLQAAKLFDWKGDPANEEVASLVDAVRTLVRQPLEAASVREAASQRPPTGKHWWQTPAGIGLGAGALLVGLSLLMIALKQVGLIGGGAPSLPAAQQASAPVAQPAASAQPAGAPGVEPSAAPSAGAGQNGTTPPGAMQPAAGERTNLLDPDAGGKLVLANEDNWRNVMTSQLWTTVITARGFGVFAFRDEKPATIDAIGVFVEATNGRNAKQLAIHASEQAETGPFRKIAVVTVPNYRNMRAPFHEFKLDPFTARYVKIEVLSWEDGEGFPNGYLGNLQLLGTLK